MKAQGTGGDDRAGGSGNVGVMQVPVPGQPGTFIDTAMAFSFSAHATDSGLRGHVNFRGAESGSGSGRIVCGHITANKATVVFEFERGQPFGPDVNFGLLAVEDNGQPSDDTPDRGIATGIAGEQGAPPPACPAAFEPMAPLQHGNVHVHDATP